MKILLHLLGTALLCSTLVQCASQPVEPKLPPVTQRLIQQSVTEFDGKTFLRQEYDVPGKPGDSMVRVTQL